MSVLIKGMAMPKNCKECWNCDSNFTDTQLRSISEWMCLVKLKFVGETGDSTRPSWCPLVEVSTPHGRLINDDDSIPRKFIDEFIREHYGKWQATSLGAMLSAWEERKARYVKDENDQEELSEELKV